MTRNGKLFLIFYLLGVGTIAALAANDTIGVTVGSGKTGNLIKFGSNNVISEVGICDATTENQCGAVSASGAVKVDNSAVTQPISAAALPLPAGAATAANQTTANTSLSTIATNTGAAVPAGTAIIGKVGIDQTTDITTNGVEIAPTAGAAAGITAVLSGAAEGSHVLKASAGNLYNAYATSTVAGYLMVFNATSAPGDGAVTPQDCVPGSLTQTGIYAATINYNPGPVEPFTTGITAVWSSTGCFTKTISATAFIHGLVK